MFRFIMAAFAAFIFVGASQAGENSHVIIEGQPASDFVRSVSACSVTDRLFGKTEAKIKAGLVKRDLDPEHHLIEERARHFVTIGVPEACVFYTVATFPEGFEEWYIVIRSGQADYFLVGWGDDAMVLTWEELHESNEASFFQRFGQASETDMFPSGHIANTDPPLVFNFPTPKG